MCAQGSKKVIGIILVSVTHSEIIHDQCELDIAGVVLPQAWGEWAGVVSMRK